MAEIDWSDPNATANGTFAVDLGSDTIDVTVTSVRVSDGALVGSTGTASGSPVLSPESSVTEPHSYTIDFGQNVNGIGFELFDIDAGASLNNKGAATGWDDQITIIARDADGNIVSLDPSVVTANYSPTDEEFVNGAEDVHEVFTLSGDPTYPDGALRIDATANNDPAVEGSGALDTLRFDLPDGVASIEIIHEDGSQAAATGVMNIGNIEFVVPDDIVEGTAGDDTIVAGSYVDEDGEEVDNLDSLGILTAAPGTNDDVIFGFEGDDFIDAGLGDDVVDGGDGDDEIAGGDGADTIDGGEGADIVDGGTGDDVITDSGTETSVREALRWGDFTSDETNVTGFVATTPENEVTFSVNVDNSVGIQGEDDQTITTDGIITGGLPGPSTNETLELESNNPNDFAEIELSFAADAEDVSFRITEIERNSEFTIRAFDRDGNEVDVTFTNVGSDVVASDTTPTSAATLTADGGGHNSADPTAAATVFIDEPIARLVIEFDSGGNASPQISDVFFTTIISADDELSGGDGADTISGGDGADTISGGEGDDDIFVGGGDDATGGSGDDVFAIDDTDSSPDVAATIDGGSDATGTGTPVEPDDTANGDAGDILDLSGLSGDGNSEDGISGVTVTYGANPEDGTVTGVDGIEDGADLTFTEIENIVYTDDDDVADASAATTTADIATGDGDDVLIGGEGDDTLDGGDGNDTFLLSEGSDTIAGGTGRDEFSAENSAALTDETITVTTDNAGDATIAKDSDGGTDSTTSIEVFTADEDQVGTDGIDEFTITGNFEESEISGIDRINAVGTWVSADPSVGTVNFGPSGPTLDEILSGSYDPGTGPVGPKGDFQITSGDESGQIGNIQFENFETINFSAVCFTAGTMIATTDGEIAIEDLCTGDLVETFDHGAQPVQWIGSIRLDANDLAANPKLRPIRIAKGALGDNLPKADLIVSRQHRVLVRSKIAKRIFDTEEVLIPAIKLTALPGIDVVTDVDDVRYFHMLFDRHEIVYSNGALTESLFTGPEALKSVSPEAREEIVTLFPEIVGDGFVPTPARLIPARGAMMKQLVARHQRNAKPLYAADHRH